MTGLRIGTSAFTAAGWEGAFYPSGMKPAEFLSYYATKFPSVSNQELGRRRPSGRSFPALLWVFAWIACAL